MKSFKPLQFQAPLPEGKLILKENPSSENVPLDVLFVGAGPAGLSGAIELARLIKKDKEAGGTISCEIGVLEKASSLGEHNLSGAVINPRALRELFPELKDADLPFRQSVKEDRVYFLTEKQCLRVPTPPSMNNHGNFVASICEVVRWMGKKAEELGVQILTGFPADSLLVDQNSKVLGVRTTPTGLNRDGTPGSGYMPGTDVTAQVTVLCEGTRGPLTQAYLKHKKISSPNPQIFALGVKEIWKTKKVPQSVIHTLGWPLPRDAFGGSFMYPMGENKVALGLVVGLDYKQNQLDVHGLLQKLKFHPLFAEYLMGGEVLEWGAKTIPEGGIYSFPEQLSGDGILLAGDTVGMVNVPALKGIHYAMQAGIYAARAIFDGLKKKDLGQKTLGQYDSLVRESYIYSDLYKTRNMRLAFKSGFFSGGFKSSLMMVSGGALCGGKIEVEEDAAEEKSVSSESMASKTADVNGIKTLAKVDGVFLSGNKTRDHIPSHLIVGKDVPPEVADLYAALCPAGVYERRGQELVVNAPNCVDCKATDVLGPRWTPREGGSGPQYKEM